MTQTHQRKNTTTPPQNHNHTTTKTQPHHHKNTTAPPQKHNRLKTARHHHKNTKNNHKNTTPPPQNHNHTATKTQPHHRKNTTTPPQNTTTPPQKHKKHNHENTTTPPQKHNHKNLPIPPQKHKKTTAKTQTHQHKNTTTPPQKPKNGTTPPQKHNRTTTRTQPHHQKNTTAPPHKHKNTKTEPQKHRGTTTKLHHTTTKTQPLKNSALFQPHHPKNTTTETQPHHHKGATTPPKTQKHNHRNTTQPPKHFCEACDTFPATHKMLPVPCLRRQRHEIVICTAASAKYCAYHEKTTRKYWHASKVARPDGWHLCGLHRHRSNRLRGAVGANRARWWHCADEVQEGCAQVWCAESVRVGRRDCYWEMSWVQYGRQETAFDRGNSDIRGCWRWDHLVGFFFLSFFRCPTSQGIPPGRRFDSGLEVQTTAIGWNWRSKQRAHRSRDIIAIQRNQKGFPSHTYTKRNHIPHKTEMKIPNQMSLWTKLDPAASIDIEKPKPQKPFWNKIQNLPVGPGNHQAMCKTMANPECQYQDEGRKAVTPLWFTRQ